MRLKAMFKTIWSRVFALVAVAWLVVVLIFAVKEYQKYFNHYNYIDQVAGNNYSPYRGIHKLCMAKASTEKYAKWLHLWWVHTALHKDYKDNEKKGMWFHEQISELDFLLGNKSEKQFEIDHLQIGKDTHQYRVKMDLPYGNSVWLFDHRSQIDLKNLYYNMSDSYECIADHGELIWVKYRGINEVRRVNIYGETIERMSPFVFLFIIPLFLIYVSQIWISKGFSSNRRLPDKFNTEEGTVSILDDDAPKSEGSSNTNTDKGRANEAKQDGDHTQGAVADELLKWAKLKEGGHISEEEFQVARDKLLKKH